MTQTIDIAGFEHHRTSKAVLFSDVGDEKLGVWLPLSLVEIFVDGGHKNSVIVRMPTWLARQKDFI